MKLSENVEIETSEVKASNSRASRMARYSAAAAGVAAVSSIEVDAAMIKVIVTDTNAQNTDSYTLDLGALRAGADLSLVQSSAFGFSAVATKALVAVSSLSSNLLTFKSGSQIGASASWDLTGNNTSLSSGSHFFGFRVKQGFEGPMFGWFKATIVSSSAFTLNSYGYNSTVGAAATAGDGEVAGVPDSGPGIVGLALIGAGAAGVRLLRKLRAGE